MYIAVLNIHIGRGMHQISHLTKRYIHDTSLLCPSEYHIHLENRFSCKHIRWDVELSPSGPVFCRTASNFLLVLEPLGLKCICSDEEHIILLREKNTPHKSSFLPRSVFLRRKSHNRHTNKVWACFMFCGEKRLLGLKRNPEWEKEMLCNCDPVRHSQLYQSPPGLNVTQGLKLDPLSTSKSPSIKWHFINLYQSQTKCIPHNCGCSKPWRPLLNLLVSL